MHYSIIIPIFNEIQNLPKLLPALLIYHKKGDEIIIVDDGSTDGSEKFLLKNDFINLLRIPRNSGKGIAIRKGLKHISNNKVILFDGDMEIGIEAIESLKNLNQSRKIHCIFGSRFKKNRPFTSIWALGNYFFTSVFNLIYDTKYMDVLCCAKSFYINNIDISKLESKSFDIDIEIFSILTKAFDKIDTVYIPYQRRTLKEGKKLKLTDAWTILFQMIRIKRF